MKKFFYSSLFAAILTVYFHTASATTISITSTTNWSAITSGSGTSGLPSASDAITVSGGATLTVDVTNGVCASLTLGAGSTTGTLTFVNSGTQSLTVNGTITVGSGTAGGTGTIHLLSVGKLTCGGLSLSSTSAASVYGDGGTLTINGPITVGSGGTYNWTPANGTVVIGATSTLPSSVFSQFYNLTINPGSSNTVTTGVDMTVNNNLTISSGTLADPSLPIHGNSTGTFTMAAGTNLTLGDPTSSTGVNFPDAFTAAHITLNPTSTVTFQTNGSQNVSSVPSYGNLILSTGSSSSTKTIFYGAATVVGTLTISSSTTFDVSTNNYGLNVAGGFTNNGAFTQRSGTVTMNGTAAQTIGGSTATTFNNLTISNTHASVSAGVSLTVSGTLTVNSSAIFDMKTYALSVGTPSNSGTINTQNTSVTPISSGKTWGGVVNFNLGSSSLQYVPAGTYAEVRANISNGSVHLTGPVDITTLVIGDQNPNTNFFDEGYQITTAKNLTIVSGFYACETSTFPWATSIIGGTVDYNADGAQTVASKTYTNLTLWGSTTKTLAASGGIVVTGVLTVNSGTTLAFGTTAQTLALTGTGSGTLVNSGTIDMSAAAHTLQVAGTSVSFGTLTIGSSSKVEYTSSNGGQTITTSLTYNNLQLDNTSGTNTAGGNLTVNGTLTIASGTLEMGTNTLSVGAASGSGTINTQNTSSTPISAGMTWGGTVNFNGSSSQTIPAGTYAGLQLNNSSGAVLGGNVNVTGTMTMTNGDLTTTSAYTVGFGTAGTLSGEASGHYIVGNLVMDEVIGASASSSRLNGIGVSISSGSDNLGAVEINRVSGKVGQATVNSGVGIYRKWSITSSNSTTSGRNMTLAWVSDDVPYGYNLTSAQVWNSTNSGSSWSSVGSAGDLSSNTVTVLPFTSSSSPTIWTISANESSPTHNALLFGGNQYIVTQSSSALKTTTVTVEAWIKPKSSPTSTEEIFRLKSSSTDDGFELVLNTDGSFKVNSLAGYGAGWLTGYSTGINVLDTNWHHVALVLNPGSYITNLCLYVDGIVAISPEDITQLADFSSNVQMYLGAHPGPSQCYSGLTAEVRIWNTARSQADIQSTMHTTLTGTESGLIGYWPLSGESGTTTSARDLVNGNNGTLYGFTFDGTTNGWVTTTDIPLPVELTEFVAKENIGSISLSWKTATEINNYGFEVERRAVSDKQLAISSWSKIGFVTGNGTSNSTHSYSYTDASVAAGTYAYRLKQIDNSGTFNYSSEAEVTIAVSKVFALNQNYPNPFNPTTTINFTLAQDGFTTLKIYDILGKEVATLVNSEMKAGIQNTVVFDASKLSSGVYFSRLEKNGNAQIQKVLMIK
jgi:hypothetical protein